MSQNPNDLQVGGNHYHSGTIQHWDYVAANNLDYFQGQITKYITRWKHKGGFQDLLKARHFLDKYIDLNKDMPPAKLGELTSPAEMKARGELHVSSYMTGRTEVTKGKFCTCATDPMFCPLHEAGPTAGYVNQG